MDEILKHHDLFIFENTPAGEPMFTIPPSLLPALALIPSNEHDSILGELRHSTSSGRSSYVGSPKSISTSHGTYSPTLNQHRNSQLYPLPPPYLESENSPVSIGDPKWYSNSPSASESSIIESMSRATPYSPEEKRERIERYRSKRNLRNFNKKIKYECRKTLADSRPRVRGRFARNGEIEKAPQSQRDHRYVEEDDDSDYNWTTILDALPANLMP